RRPPLRVGLGANACRAALDRLVGALHRRFRGLAGDALSGVERDRWDDVPRVRRLLRLDGRDGDRAPEAPLGQRGAGPGDRPGIVARLEASSSWRLLSAPPGRTSTWSTGCRPC